MVHIMRLNEMVNLELHFEAENKIRDIARTNTDCFEDCGEGMLSISLFNTNFNIPPRMRLYSYEVMVQVYPNDERDVYVVGYKENGENNWWTLNQFTQKEQNDIVDAVQASVNKIKEGGMFSENRRTANAHGRINEMNVGKVDLEWDAARCDEFINNVEYKYLRMFTMFMNGEQFANYKYITPEGVQNLGNEIKMKNLNPSDVMCDILNKNTRGVEYRRILGIPDNANERYNYVGNSPHLCAIMMKYIITNILDANAR